MRREDDEEEPGKIKDESGSDDDSDRKPTGKSTGQAKGEDDTNNEVSWWDEHTVVLPRELSSEKAALVKVFTRVLKIDVACVRPLVEVQDLRSQSDYRAFLHDMFPTQANLNMSNLKNLRVFCDWLDHQPTTVHATDFTQEVLECEIATTASKKDSSPKDRKATAPMPDKFGGTPAKWALFKTCLLYTSDAADE